MNYTVIYLKGGESIKIYGIYIEEELDSNQFWRLLSIVDENKRTRIQSFFRQKDRERCLIGDVLVRYLLATQYNLCLYRQPFCYNDWGKPFAGVQNVHFNISHSGDWVVCVIDDEENGIDIQKKDRVDIDLAKRFFLTEEYLALKSQSESQKSDMFYDLWTLKESYIKITGKGLSIPLNSFTLDSIGNNQYISTYENSYVYLNKYNIDSDYKLAVSSYKNIFPNIQTLSSLDLYGKIMNFSQIGILKY